MTDFWFLFGAMTIDKDLLGQFVKQNWEYKRIGLTLHEISGHADASKTLSINVPAAGYLDETKTTSLRRLLRDKTADAAKYTAPPIISLYTAGKLAQLSKTFEAGLRDSLADANTAFLAAKDAGLTAPYRCGFVAFLGACLIDTAVHSALLNAADPDLQKDIAEFGMTAGSPEHKTAVAFGGHEAFTAAHARLFGGDEWEPQCGQKFFFYPEFKRAAN